ncbi:MAG TPA: glycosyltransferase [Pyrinomonadaceae bacterium]|nr:glycosyltransferase [Pyrinomonadaceae bacterium]
MRYNALQLIGSFHQGGSERQAVQLTRLLLESGRCNVFVVTLERDGVLLDEINRLGLSQIPEFRLNSFYDFHAFKQVRRFAQFLKRHEIDVVHAHDFYTNIFGMAAAALARVPVRIASRRESAVRPETQRFVERAAYRVAHAVVANCEDVRQQLIREGVPARKVRTVYNGLDLARVQPAVGKSERNEILRALKLPEQARFVTIMANMRAHVREPEPLCYKDHPTFLRAARRVYDSVPDAAFIIAGEGELLDATRELARSLGIADRTFFIGRCQDVGSVLSISDVCVLSSSSEGFSNAILEYMAAGRPVVATDVGGAREAVVHGETGYLVPSGDHEQMAGHIISLLLDQDTASSMGESGRRRVNEKFSTVKQLQSIESLYTELLGLGPAWVSRLSRVDPN